MAFVKNIKRVHFIGIGGIGVSALARYFLSEGVKVTGSDLFISDLTEDIERAGISFYKGHQASNLRADTDLVIYSAAVTKDNPELVAARGMQIHTQSYAEALGALAKKYFTIAVSGSHGKSTTTALLGLILTGAGLDPTVIVGTKVKEFSQSGHETSGSNFRKGKSKYLVIEADEYNRSFHHYLPQIAVITNIDKEHLDVYKTFRGVVAGFEQYMKNLKKGGHLVLNWQDRELRRIGEKYAKGKKLNVHFYNRGASKRYPLLIPGPHNQINALAAWEAAKILGVSESAAEKVFRSYQGAWRRFELLPIRDARVTGPVYSDYAHHPTEIKATLEAFREKYPRGRVVVVFEPHQADRLTRLFPEFTQAFDGADKIILLPVYKVSGREEGTEKDSFTLAQAVSRRKRQTFYASDFSSAIKLLKTDFDSGAVVVFMGAGTIDTDARKFFRI